MTDEHTVSYHPTSFNLQRDSRLSLRSKASCMWDDSSCAAPLRCCSPVEKFEFKPHLMIANDTEAILDERHKRGKGTEHLMPSNWRRRWHRHLTSQLSFPLQNETHVVQAGSWVCLYAPPKRDTQPLTELSRTQLLHDRRHQDSLRKSCSIPVFQPLPVGSSFQGGVGCV